MLHVKSKLYFLHAIVIHKKLTTHLNGFQHIPLQIKIKGFRYVSVCKYLKTKYFNIGLLVWGSPELV